MSGARMFTGLGKAGDWSDPANWSGGTAAGANAFAVIPVSTTMDGAFTNRILMMLGDETVTVNGAITTTSPGLCISFMVCNSATAIFRPTSSLHDAGGIVVGADAVGSLVAQGNASARSTLSTVSGKIGLHAGSVGHMSIDGGVWDNSANIYVGLNGNGTLNVDQGGVVHAGTSFVVGAMHGSSGTVSIQGGGRIEVGGYAQIGGGSPQAGGGAASVSIGAGCMLDVGSDLKISATAGVSLAGGSVEVHTGPLRLLHGGSIAGNGTISASSGGIMDAGTITAGGGTLVLDGALGGGGVVRIADTGTAVLNSMTIGGLTLAFAGAGGTLSLAHGVACDGTIAGFAAGDHILMEGVDAIGWNAGTDVLTLSEAGSVVDTLHLTGTYAGDAFTLTQTDAGALIGVGVH